MLIGRRFREFREAKGLSEVQVAERIRPSFQDSLLWDFEGFDDNDIDGWSIHDFKKYCAVLGVQPTEYADIPLTDIHQLPLHELVQKRREEMRISVSELSDHIGYEESVVDALEGRRADMTVCMHALKATALKLNIPFRVLLEKL
jgi:transcriptional regulator with XRE-family HTH domain